MSSSLERRDRSLKLTAIATLLQSSRDRSLAHLYSVDEWIQYAAELSLLFQPGSWFSSRIQDILVRSSLIDDDEFMEQLEQKREALRGDRNGI